MKRILVPLDGSSLAEAALPAAARIARAMGAELLLLHVIEASPPGEIHGERHLSTVVEAKAYLQERAAQVLSSGGGIRVEIHVHEEGIQDAARAIGEHVEELRSDLAILATHGPHRFGRFLRGSVAQRALFFGGAPILTLPATGASDSSLWKTLVVAADGSGEHPLPLEWLGQLARALALGVDLLLVVDTRYSLHGDKMAMARSMPGATKWALEAAVLAGESWLKEVAASPALAGLEVRSELLRGSADKALAQRTKDHPGDIVVIGTHGRAGLDAMWEGSMAAKILARLEAPVLLIPLGSKG